MKVIAIVSGGMDSVTLAYWLKDKGHTAHLLGFNYGQRHQKELSYVQATATRLGMDFDLIDLSGLTHLLKGSALTDNVAVPDGHYAEATMKITVVPNRNAIMLAIAFGVAVAEQADAVAIAVHAGDHFIYPDCRPEFATAFNDMQQLAIEGFGHCKLLTPFIYITKAQIAKIGAELNVPFEETWSCYKGQDVHCGVCGTCTERREALELAGVQDKTVYGSLEKHYG